MTSAAPAVLCGAFAVTLCAVTQCSSQNGKRPDALGGCLPTADAGCSPPGEVATGANTFEAGTSSSSSGISSSGAIVNCGGAEGSIATNNLLCHPCIISACCQADTACTGSCQTLLACIEGCSPAGDPQCVGTCENVSQDGFAAYRDLANCVSMNCATQCPVLPL
ncbi:MAG: hypothetical protein JOZ69_12165 [Myxococcales bacterium]|nr:hypothetical protein [Myxococcales bacterium]